VGVVDIRIFYAIPQFGDFRNTAGTLAVDKTKYCTGNNQNIFFYEIVTAHPIFHISALHTFYPATSIYYQRDFSTIFSVVFI
jgi:hypothetical protein